MYSRRLQMLTYACNCNAFSRSESWINSKDRIEMTKNCPRTEMVRPVCAKCASVRILWIFVGTYNALINCGGFRGGFRGFKDKLIFIWKPGVHSIIKFKNAMRKIWGNACYHISNTIFRFWGLHHRSHVHCSGNLPLTPTGGSASRVTLRWSWPLICSPLFKLIDPPMSVTSVWCRRYELIVVVF